MRECEEMLKIVQRSKDSQLDLAGSLRLATRSCTRAKHAEKLNHHASCSTTEQKVKFGCLVTSWLELATQSSREVKPPTSSVLKKLTLHISNTHKYKYPLYPRNVESFQREY